MATTLTTHYSWVKPNPFEEIDLWGQELNANLDAQDTKVFAVETSANNAIAAAAAALPKSGGTMTGAITLAADGASALQPASFGQLTTTNNALTTGLAGKQPLDATLTGLATLTANAENMIYATGVDTFAVIPTDTWGRGWLFISSANLGRSTLDVDQKGVVSYKAVSTTAYTLVSGDRGNMLDFTFSGVKTLTIPTFATVPFQVGTRIDLAVSVAGTLTIGGAGVTIQSLNAALTITKLYAGATLYYKGADTWLLIGNLG